LPIRARRIGARLAARALAAAAALGGAAVPGLAQTADLVSRTSFRVCADPANSPMSSRDGKGFENRIAALFADRLGLPVEYMWFPMATGFVRKTLLEYRCDVIVGFAQGQSMLLSTNHYYTSSYVIVTRADSDLAAVDSLSDKRLKGRRLGVIAGSPPTSHFARLGLLGQIKPYQLFVDRRFYSPNEEMLADLRKGDIDAAFMWGPIAGPLVKAGRVAGAGALKVTPLLKETLPPKMFYRITMAVRPGELIWKRKLNSLIRKNQGEIDAIMTEFGVPLLDDMGRHLKGVTQ